MEEQGFNIWNGWGDDTLDGCAEGNWEAGSHASNKAQMNAHTELVTVHQVAFASAADFPPGFPHPPPGLGLHPQPPPGLGGYRKQGPLSALPHSPPELGDHLEHESLPALPHAPPALENHPQQEPLPALPHPPPGLGHLPQQDTLPALLHPSPGLGDLPQQEPLPALHHSPPRLGHLPQQEAVPALPHQPPRLVGPQQQQQQQPAAVGQPQADPAADGQPVQQAGQEKRPEVDGDYFYRHKVRFTRLQQLRIHNNSTYDWVNGVEDDEQERLHEEREATLRRQDRESWNKRGVWDHSGFVERIRDAWGDGAPAIPGLEAATVSLSAAHAGAALAPDDPAADGVTGSAVEASAAARQRGRSRQTHRYGCRQGNSSWAGTANPSRLPNGPCLLPGHAQQGVQHPLVCAWACFLLICRHLQ